VPLFLLSRLVRQSDRKVVLTGEGADELLAGYSIFKEDQVRRFWARQPDSKLRPQLLDKLHSYVGGDRSRASEIWRKFFGNGLLDVDHPFYSHLIRWKNTSWSARFLAAHVQAELVPERMMADLAALMPLRWNRWNPLARAQATEISTFLSGYLLSCQGDRVAMAHGVEVRYPFLDPDVVDLCCALPQRFKLLGLRDKLALRRLASGLLPSEIAARPKQPYRAPMAPVLFADGAPETIFRDLDVEALRRFGLVEVEPARKLVEKAASRNGVMGGEREEMALIGVLTLQILARQFLEEFGSREMAARATLERMVPTVTIETTGAEGGVA
jgi:asparagine synthase (glutamine-hydrolysing)